MFIRIRQVLILVGLVSGLLLGCDSRSEVTNNYPVPLTRPGQTRQLYHGFVASPTPSLTPDSISGIVSFTLLGYGAVPYVIADGSAYVFPLNANRGAPTVTVEKGVVAEERITLDPDAEPVVITPQADTRYPLAGITYWSIQVPGSILTDWARPILHIAYSDVYVNDGTEFQGDMYYPLGR